MEGALCCLWWFLWCCSNAQSGTRPPRFFAATITQDFAVLYLALSECPLKLYRRLPTLQCRGFCHCGRHVHCFHNTNYLPQPSELGPLWCNFLANLLWLVFSTNIWNGVSDTFFRLHILLTVFSMRVRAGLVSVIFKKALVLSNDERTRASGDIVNLMSVDATRLQDLCTYGLTAISGPLQASYMLKRLFDHLIHSF